MKHVIKNQKRENKEFVAEWEIEKNGDNIHVCVNGGLIAFADTDGKFWLVTGSDLWTDEDIAASAFNNAGVKLNPEKLLTIHAARYRRTMLRDVCIADIRKCWDGGSC